uniref:Protein kinase domain-containing protein n=1 Tax=Oryzias latipes TaxID=8090 RepID=A0A3B3IQ12_ORYLA
FSTSNIDSEKEKEEKNKREKACTLFSVTPFRYFLGGNIVAGLPGNETFAIKIVDDLRAGSEEMEAMKIIRSLNPDQNNLIKIHECFQYKDYMCLVYEMLDESLEDFIGKRSFHPAHLCQIRAIAQQMLVALSGLESINVLHGDIKPDNIMFVDQITNPLKLKLIDFGLAVNPQELNVGTQMQINPFRAPEVILGLPLDVSVDMWSLAVVLATLYIGDVPFSYNSDYETIRGLVQLLGLPEDDLLHYGKFSYDFFTYEEESSQPGWRLNTPFEYSEATGEVVKGLNEIPDLDAMAEFHHDTFPLYEEDDHRAFLDLLRSMLAIDPRQRMTPSSALAHDFITMNHLSGERKASYAFIYTLWKNPQNKLQKQGQHVGLLVNIVGCFTQQRGTAQIITPLQIDKYKNTNKQTT